MRKFCCCKKVFCNTILTKSVYCDIIFCAPDNSGAENKIFIGVWLSLVECLVRDQEAGGSNPLTPTREKRRRLPSFFVVRRGFEELGSEWQPWTAVRAERDRAATSRENQILSLRPGKNEGVLPSFFVYQRWMSGFLRRLCEKSGCGKNFSKKYWQTGFFVIVLHHHFITLKR